MGSFRADSVPRRRDRGLLLWLKQFWDPRFTIRGLGALPRYLGDAFRYRNSMPASARRQLVLTPQLHDRTATSPIDQHYFFLNGWTLRKLVGASAPFHLDVGSQVDFANSAAAICPTIFVDVRVLEHRMDGLFPVAGDMLSLPFSDDSVPSISCLHVAEHIGLGRYGDALDPRGTEKAALELTRVLAPGGDLFLGLPIGIPRTYFNAHRVHSVDQIERYFEGLMTLELSAVTDSGKFIRNCDPSTLEHSHYACGMFHLRKPGP